jgi:hypothetical protein
MHHICVGIRHKEMPWKVLNNTEYEKIVRKSSGGV